MSRCHDSVKIVNNTPLRDTVYFTVYNDVISYLITVLYCTYSLASPAANSCHDSLARRFCRLRSECTGHVVNRVVNSERSESTLRGVRGAPGAHSRRVTTDRPPITRRRRALRTEQTTPRPGPLLRATAEHTSGPQNVFAAEERPELRRSPAEMHRTE